MNLRELQESGQATLTIEETASLLRLSRGSTRQAIQAGSIPILKLGRRILIPVPGLMKLLGVSEEGPCDTDLS